MRMRAMVSAIGLVAASPATAETIHMTGTFPALARALVGTERLGIDRFGGAEGGTLAVAIARQLEEPDADGPAHFALIGPDGSPDVLLTGSVGVDVDHDDYRQERSRCAEKQDGKCVRHEKYRVACTRRSIEVTAEVRGILPRDGGRTGYGSTKPRRDTASWCEDEGDPVSADRVIDGMIASIAREVRTDVAPHADRYGVRIREGRDGMAKPVAARFKAAVHLTNRDEQAGCAAFRTLAADAPDHPSIAFNVALCTEAAGDYARAATLYRDLRLRSGKGGDLDEGIRRTDMLLTAEADAAREGRTPPPRLARAL